MQKDSDELVGMTCILSFVKNRLTSFKFVILGHIKTHVDIWGTDKYSYIHTHKCTNVNSYIHTRTYTYIYKHRKVCDYTNLLSFLFCSTNSRL